MAFLCLVPGATPVRAGTTGTISGKVTDQDGRPVVAATVLVVGTRLGAYSDSNGDFTILNVSPGTYEVKASRLGFNAVTVSEVSVSSDRATVLEMKMGDTNLKTEEVVVVAARPPVDLKITSSQSNLTKEDINNLPVQNLEDVVNLQAGVVDGHFRGGRQDEVQYQVDGVSVNNAFDNSSSLQIDRSLLQEVQVISGTFDAEYGQAMSGVVNAVLKQGTEDFLVDGEVYTGGFYFVGNEEARRTDDTPHLTGTQSYQLTLSGPVPLGDTTYLLSGRRYLFDDYVYAERVFNPTDQTDSTGAIIATGDGATMPLGYSDQWSGVFKLANNSLANSRISYQAVFSSSEGRANNYAFRFMPDALSLQNSFSISHGFDWTQTLGATTFLDLSLRQNYFNYEDHLYEDPFDSRYDAAPQLNNSGTNGDFYYQGVQTNHYVQNTNSFIFKGSVVSQVNPENQMKTGVEFSLPIVEFGTDMYFTYPEGSLVRHPADPTAPYEPPDYPGPQTYYPVMGAAYIQDQFERSDLIVRFGARLDYFDAQSTVPSDPANPANAIEGAPESHPQATTVKTSISPRLGVAYPIEDKAAVHFAYGHFIQFPSVGTMFANSDYDILERLQAGTVSYGVLGNPDVKPETTVQYEIGYKQILSEEFGFDLTMYYKDVRDLMGVEFVSTYTGAEYARLTNVDFGSITGITLSLDYRQVGPLTLAFDYTWQRANGNASDPSETANRAAAGEDPRPQMVPFNWDQTHTLNLTAAFNKPGKYSISSVIKGVSGQRYTPQSENAFGFGSATNSGHKPSAVLVDLRAEWILKKDGRGGLFMRIFNVFDARYFNGPVYATTGSPYYARFPSPGELVSLADPTRLYQPRRVEFGVRWGWGGP